MTRSLLLVLAIFSGCAATRGQLIDGPATLTNESTATCSDIVIKRPALASRWGEYFKVRIDQTDAVIVGQAKLKVGGKVEKEKAFFVSGKDLVLDLRWANERLDVPSALARGAQLELSLSDLTAAAGRCENVRFNVEHGPIVPDIEESAWIAQLGGGAKTVTATTTTRRAPAPTASPKPTSPSKENDWVAWVGKNADFDTSEWKPWPLARLTAPRVGTPLSKGVWLAFSARHALSPKYAKPSSPEQMSALVERVRAQSRSDDEAVFALFGGRTQGAELALSLATAFTLRWPVPDLTEVSSPFGMRTHPILKGERLHTGIDLSVREGTPIIASGPGVVIRTGETKVNGRFLIIDHGHGVTTAYLHNQKVLVTEGQQVTAGTFVALSGNTGRSTGPHLHYQLELSQQPVDPLFFRAAPSRLANR